MLKYLKSPEPESMGFEGFIQYLHAVHAANTQKRKGNKDDDHADTNKHIKISIKIISSHKKKKNQTGTDFHLYLTQMILDSSASLFALLSTLVFSEYQNADPGLFGSPLLKFYMLNLLLIREKIGMSLHCSLSPRLSQSLWPLALDIDKHTLLLWLRCSVPGHLPLPPTSLALSAALATRNSNNTPSTQSRWENFSLLLGSKTRVSLVLCFPQESSE